MSARRASEGAERESPALRRRSLPAYLTDERRHHQFGKIGLFAWRLRSFPATQISSTSIGLANTPRLPGPPALDGPALGWTSSGR